MADAQQDFGYGQQDPVDSGSEFNSIIFACKQLIARISTMKLVQVQAVTNDGGVVAAGTVDVLPMVSQLDGQGNSTPHGTIFGVPYFRLQGGVNAVIIDPVVGDIGYMVCADRDISAVKSTKAPAPPGSYRKYAAADGVYVGGCLNGAPEQYIVFTSTGIRIVDKNGNSVAMSNTGMTLIDKNGNQFQMKAGIVNVVTTSFQVNGVPVTVP